MSGSGQDRLRGHLGRGFLTSVLVHAGLVLPFIALSIVFARREAENRDLDVRFEDVSPAELPDNLPPLPEDSAEPSERRVAKNDRARPKDVVPEPKPQAEPEKVEPPPDEPRPKLVPEKAHQKMVDLDMGKDVPPPPDAKYLAQKNNRAEEETRARDTNLVREQKGDKGSSPSDRKDDEVGDDKRKIAELQDQKSQRGRSAPQVTPHAQSELARPTSPPKSLLSMRDTPRRTHDITPETADPSLPHDPDGTRPMPLDERPEAVRDLGGAPGEAQRQKLALTGKQYEYVFGADAEAARRLAQEERSKRPGKFAQRLGRIQSALENFIPEVRPGNQTALNTRAAPFAAYIARMHRSIHKLWGFGFLEDLDSKPGSSPFNDPNLLTKLEIVLNGDGTVDKVTVIKTSGYTPFDVAAIDTVYSAGPYADPPREIRSGNGKIYVHWTFHRDDRQCATSYVDYFILDNAQSRDKGEPEASRGLPAPQVRPQSGLKRLQRSYDDTPTHRAKMRELDAAAGGAETEPDPAAAKRAAQQVVRGDDPAARALAEDFLGALARHDVTRMLKQAAFPFRSHSGVAAKTPAELKAMLEDLVAESAGARAADLQLYSPAGARGAIGPLPSGFEEGGVLFGVARFGDDHLIIVLGQRSGVWKVVGLLRR